MFEELIKAGADVNQSKKVGVFFDFTQLLLLTQYCCVLLLQTGENPLIILTQNDAPTPIVELVIKAGGDVHRTTGVSLDLQI